MSDGFGVMKRSTSKQNILDDIYETALSIRAFEYKLLDLFRERHLSGTVHTYIGQELCASALYPHLDLEMDAVFGTHRCHGHYLAYGGPLDRLFAELMGREGALCQGRGGSQHLHYHRFFSTGIQGSVALLATGYAYAAKYREEGSIVIAQIGDGTLGEGALYEAFTFAALLQVPVLFLIEYNGYAQSTDVTTTTPGDIVERIAGFGLEVDRCSDLDPEVLFTQYGNVVEKVRSGRPFVQIVDTRRLMAHSKGDDSRPLHIVKELWQEDPLANMIRGDHDMRMLYEEATSEINRIADVVLSCPLLSYTEATALPKSSIIRTADQIRSYGSGEREPRRIVEELNACLDDLLANHKEVVLIGEDILDPYGGAFKVSRGLSTRYPDQIFSTPIAEAAIVGVSNGMALAGMRPIAEIMFADFVTLAADQVINHAAKFHYMYGGETNCPLTVRLVSGGRRGYGPTHSQCLENLFFGIPGLRIVSLSHRHDPRRLLKEVVLNDNGPTLFVENKKLYAQQPASSAPLDLQPVESQAVNGDFPDLCYTPLGREAPEVTIVTYGGMATEVEVAMRELIIEDELRFDYIIVTQLWPLNVERIISSVRTTRRLVVVEENPTDFGFSSGVIARVVQQVNCDVLAKSVGAVPVPIPAARQLEDNVLPSSSNVVSAVREVMEQYRNRLSATH